MEQTLLGLGVASVTTVDYNEPVLAEGTPAALSTLSVQGLARAYAAKRRFDLIVAFSGIEHDGLGRYGDPLHPDGDLAAMAELRAFLSPSGLLLLGVPTAARDDLYFPNHRIYGPVRLPMLLRGFRLLGRVWALPTGGNASSVATRAAYVVLDPVADTAAASLRKVAVEAQRRGQRGAAIALV